MTEEKPESSIWWESSGEYCPTCGEGTEHRIEKEYLGSEQVIAERCLRCGWRNNF